MLVIYNGNNYLGLWDGEEVTEEMPNAWKGSDIDADGQIEQIESKFKTIKENLRILYVYDYGMKSEEEVTIYGELD